MLLDPIHNNEYLPQCFFDSLCTPDAHHIITQELPLTTNYIGYDNVWNRYGISTQLLEVEFWVELVDELVGPIKATLSTTTVLGKSTTQQTKMIKTTHRQLA